MPQSERINKNKPDTSSLPRVIAENDPQTEARINSEQKNGFVATDLIAGKDNFKETDVLYHQLIQALSAAIYTCDANGYILTYNQAAVDLWGREPQIGKDLWCGSWKIYATDSTPFHLINAPWP